MAKAWTLCRHPSTEMGSEQCSVEEPCFDKSHHQPPPRPFLYNFLSRSYGRGGNLPDPRPAITWSSLTKEGGIMYYVFGGVNPDFPLQFVFFGQTVPLRELRITCPFSRHCVYSKLRCFATLSSGWRSVLTEMAPNREFSPHAEAAFASQNKDDSALPGCPGMRSLLVHVL